MEMSAGNIMVFEGPGRPMKQLLVELPALLPGEVLVKNKHATICGSDLHTYCGTRHEVLPTVLGHEIVGEIVAFSPEHSRKDEKNTGLEKGDLVTWSIFSSDNSSWYSGNGMPQKGADLFKYGHAKITDGDSFHGGFGQFCVLKKGTAILKVPAGVPVPVAATVNCAISTVAGSVRLAGDLKDKNVLIFGTGLLGLTCIAMAKESGAPVVTVVDLSDERLAQAKGFGADHIIRMNDDTAPSLRSVAKEFSRDGFDVVFDMSGSPEAMELGIELMAVGGVAVWVGAVFKTKAIRIDAENLIRRLLTIKGLHNYNYHDFIFALDFITACWNKYPFEKVVEKVFELDDLDEAFRYALDKKPLRVGINI